MRFALAFFIATALPALPVLAQRHRGGGGGGGGGFFNGGDNGPNTFITITTAAPPTAPSAGAPPRASQGNNAPADNTPANGGGGATGGGNGAVDASLIPPFGITAGIKANDGTANCVGDGGKGIPCDCPPSLNTFVGAVEDSVARGAAFPTGNSAADQLARLMTCIVTLQNFKGGPGSGVGCPAVSTTWKELQADLQSQLK